MATKRKVGRPKGVKNTLHKPPGKYIVLFIRSDAAEQARVMKIDMRAVAYAAIYKELQEQRALYEWAAQEEILDRVIL